MDKNIVRNWSNSTKPYLDKYIGAKFIYFHTLSLILLVSLLLFSNNIIYLTMGIVYLTFETFLYLVHHDCPLTVLEEQYKREHECCIIDKNKKCKKK